MKILKNPNIFVRVVVLFLGLIIPLYIVVFVINHTSSSILRKEIAGSMESRISSYSELIDSEINHIEQMKSDLLYDEDLQKLSTVSFALTPYERLSAINRLAKKLLNFKESSRLVADVQIYIPNVEKTLHPSSFIAPMIASEMAMIRESNTTRSPRILLWQNELILALYDPPFSGARTNFYFKIVLSRESLINTLSQITAKEDGKFFLIDSTRTWMLSNTLPEPNMLPSLVTFLKKPTAGSESGFGHIELEDKDYFGAYRSSKYINTTLVVAVLDSRIFGMLDRYNLLLWLLSLLTLIIVIIFSYRMYLMVHRPLQVIVRALRKVEGGDLNISLSHGKHDEFQYLFGQFNRMVIRLQALIHEVYEEKIHSQQAELKQLQSQINPHFLYNTIFVLHRMAASYGLPDVTRFTDFLGKYFLFLTRTGVNIVGLQDEWNHAIVYTEIQRIRFAERIEVSWPEFLDSYKAIQVPRMIIQPLLENAYKYGLEKKLNHGILRITASRNEDSMWIVVEDNGEYLDEATLRVLKEPWKAGLIEEEVTGLMNVHRRLQLYYGTNTGLRFERSELGGLKVTIEIPHTWRAADVSLIDRG